MSLFLSICLYFCEAFALVVGVLIVVALGLGVLIVRELNRILSVTEEYEIHEKADSFKNLSFSLADGSEGSMSVKANQSIALTP
jgi:hypothetical protein